MSHQRPTFFPEAQGTDEITPVANTLGLTAVGPLNDVATAQSGTGTIAGGSLGDALTEQTGNVFGVTSQVEQEELASQKTRRVPTQQVRGGGGPGDGSDDEDDEDHSGGGPGGPGFPGGSSGSRGGERRRASSAERRQMFKVVQSYYKSDSEKFHGRDDENVEEFLETYQDLFYVAGMPLSMAADLVPFVLAGAAKDHIRMLPRHQPWALIREALVRQFASSARRQRLTQLYQSLVQRTPSGVDVYYEQLVDLARQLPNAYRTPDLLRDKFISGLHESIREAVLLVDPPTLQSAYDRAKLVVQARRSKNVSSSTARGAYARTIRPDGRRRFQAASGSRIGGRRIFVVAGGPAANRSARAKRPEKGQSFQGSPSDVICWDCGELGHYARDHRRPGGPAGSVRDAGSPRRRQEN